MPESTHNVARRTALIFVGIILAFLGATLAWLYPEVKRVVRERKQRQTENARGTEMVPVPGNSFTMGANDGAPEAKPLHDVRVNPFLMDKTEVTNEQFAQFVTATSYVTTAERPPAGADKLPPEQREPGSWCFRFSPDTKASGRRPWAQWVAGANWRQPDGPGSNIEGCGKFPVVHVSWDDAVAFAKWSGKRLPTEAEWECAARGAVVLAHFPWGMEACPDGRWRANVWQGDFPA
jgi:formylglycine-generating enzyme required for sulfatase activity